MHGAVLASDAGDGGHAPPAADFRGGNLQQVVVGIIFYADNDFPRAEAGDEIVGVWEIIVGKKPHEIVESIQICLAVQRRPAAVLAVKLSLILIEEHGIGIKIRHQGHIHVLSLYRKKKQKTVECKELRVTPNIEIHDFTFKAKNARKFLSDGNKVRITVRFRGREVNYVKMGEDVLNQFIEELKDVATVEKKPFLEGKNMFIILAPNK